MLRSSTSQFVPRNYCNHRLCKTTAEKSLIFHRDNKASETREEAIFARAHAWFTQLLVV